MSDDQFDAAALIAGRQHHAPGSKRGARDAATQAARNKERSRRSVAARNRAVSVLIDLHLGQYRALYSAALTEVNAERGPRPGDEATT